MIDAFAPKAWTPSRKDGQVVNALSIDVEDYFHAQALGVARDRWQTMESRVEASTNRILDLLAAHRLSATFFALGWVAQGQPALIRRIVAEGHELASHGWEHMRVDAQTPEQFRTDIRRSKALLEDIGGVAVRGYRAATFSIGRKTPWAFSILAEEGFCYSSSVYPVRHDYYGMADAPRFAFHPVKDSDFEEYPMTSLRIAHRNFPCSGGGYFRLLPYPLSRWALQRVNSADGQPCVFYFHPWEIDAAQPRLTNLRLKSRFRHYTNLGRMEGRLQRLFADFQWDRIDRVLLDHVSHKEPPCRP